MSDQRSLLRGRLASVIDGVADVAAQLAPPAARPAAPPPPPAPPGRAWTLALAMEPIPTLPAESVTASAPPAGPPGDPARPYSPPSHHRFPAIMGSAVAGLVVAVAIVVQLLPGTPHRAPAQVSSPVELTAVRPVAAPAHASGSVPTTQVSFPAGTSTVSIEVDAAATTRQAPVEIVVSVGQPAAIIIDNNYILNSSGATLIPLTPPTGGFPPGDYAVAIRESSDNTTLGTTAFEVR